MRTWADECADARRGRASDEPHGADLQASPRFGVPMHMA